MLIKWQTGCTSELAPAELRKIQAAGLMLATETAPNIGLAKNVRLKTNRGVVGDAKFKASEDIYVAGDVAGINAQVNLRN